MEIRRFQAREAPTLASRLKPNRLVKPLLLLAIIIVAALAGAYYYVSHPSAQFIMYVDPPTFHAAAGGGFILFIEITRAAGFTNDVSVTLQNPPSWITAPTLVINSTSVNGTLAVPLSNQAQKGSYLLTVVGTAQGSAEQTSTVTLKVVGVNLVTAPTGSALVYETTKVLDAATLAALVSIVNGTFQFSHSTPLLAGLEPDDVMIVSFNKTSLAPHGFLRTVIDVRQQNGGVLVDTRAASLLEMAEDIQIGPGEGGTGSSGTSVASVGSQPKNAYDACQTLACATIFSESVGADNIKLGGTAQFSFGGSVGLYFGAGGHIKGLGIEWLAFGLFGHEDLHASIKGSAGDVFTLDNPDIQTLYGPQDVDVIDGFVWFTIGVTLAAHSWGVLKENVDMGVQQDFDLVLAVTHDANKAPAALKAYCSSGGWNVCAVAQPTYSHHLSVGQAQPYTCPTVFSIPICPMARVEVGPSLSASIDGGINAMSCGFLGCYGLSGGFSGSASIEPDLFWELDQAPAGTVVMGTHMPAWSLYMGITGSATVGISLFGCAALVHKWCGTKSLASYTYQGPDFVRIKLADASQPLGPPIPTPTLTANGGSEIDLGRIEAFREVGWEAKSGPDPQGLSVTCIWQTAELGEIGTSPARPTSGKPTSSLMCPSPATQLSVDQANEILMNGLTKMTLTVVENDSSGLESAPSNALTVNLIPPYGHGNLQLAIRPPGVLFKYVENQPFTITARAQLRWELAEGWNGNLCTSALADRLRWVVTPFSGGMGMGATVSGYPNDPNTMGTSCTAQLTIPAVGENVINFFMVDAAGSVVNQGYNFEGGVLETTGKSVVSWWMVKVLSSVTLTINPTSGPDGTVTTLSGSGYTQGATYSYCLSTSSSSVSCVAGTSTPTFQADSSGNIPSGTSLTVIEAPPGSYWVIVYSGSTVAASAPFTVTTPPPATQCGTVTVTVTPSSESVTLPSPGGSSAQATYTVTITAPASGFGAVGETFGFPSSDNYGLPISGVEFSSNPTPPTTAGQTSVTETITFDVPYGAPVGTYQFTITVSGIANNAPCDSGAGSASLTITQGPPQTSAALSISSTSDFSGTVVSGTTASFSSNPTPATTAGQTSITVTLTVDVGPTTPTGSYQFTVTYPKGGVFRAKTSGST